MEASLIIIKYIYGSHTSGWLKEFPVQNKGYSVNIYIYIIIMLMGHINDIYILNTINMDLFEGVVGLI